MNMLSEMYITTGILLIILRPDISIADKRIDLKNEIIDLEYDKVTRMTEASDSATNRNIDSNVQQNFTNCKDSATEEESDEDEDDSDSKEEYNEYLPKDNISDLNSKLLYNYMIPLTNEDIAKEHPLEKLEELYNKNAELEAEEENESGAEDEDNYSNLQDEEDENEENENQSFEVVDEETEDCKENEGQQILRNDILPDGKYFLKQRNFSECNEDEKEEEKEKEGEGNHDEKEVEDLSVKNLPFEFSTLEPYKESIPVSYSSVVYDPHGNSKSELWGSFYKKPLRTASISEVFPRIEDNTLGHKQTISITKPLEDNEQIVLSSKEEEKEEINMNPEDIDCEHRSLMHKTNMNSINPIMSHSFEVSDATEVVTPTEKSNIFEGIWISPIENPHKAMHFQLHEESTRNDDIHLKNASMKPAKYNERIHQQVHDKNNIEEYYEQILNRRFKIKKKETTEENNHEAEERDLAKPEGETWKDWIDGTHNNETEGNDVNDEVINTSTMTKNEGNQIYEYFNEDDKEQSDRKEDRSQSEFAITETKKEEEIPEEITKTEENTTEKDSKLENRLVEKVTEVKKMENVSQPYAFGMIAKPKINKILTFKNPQNDAILNNQIISNFHSVFEPQTPQPDVHYDNSFLPVHESCRHGHLPFRDTTNYELFIKSSQIHANNEEEDHQTEKDEGENGLMPASRKLPTRTYIMREKRPFAKIPKSNVIIREKEIPQTRHSPLRLTIYPYFMTSHRNKKKTRPANYKNTIFLGPVASPNKIIKRIVYYKPNNLLNNMMNYGSTNKILRLMKPQMERRDNTGVPLSKSGFIHIIRNL